MEVWWMKNALRKGFALGLGLAIVGKEQIEKWVDELVKKGELSQHESSAFTQELIQKGEEAQQKLDERIQQKLKNLLTELNLATKDDIKRLEERIEELEQREQAE
jgi:polyhydroxyalkanoate synthesis regulator phasin